LLRLLHGALMGFVPLLWVSSFVVYSLYDDG